MPSLQHAIAARLIPRLRPNAPLDDLAGLRAQLVEDNRAVHEGPSDRVRRGHEERIDTDHGFPVVSLWRPGPSGETPTRALIYLHGGAYVRPADDRHWRLVTRLISRLGDGDWRAVVPLYPLAPEFTVEDSFEAMADLVEDVAAQSPGGVVLAGDSAGGGYALAVAEALRDRGRQRACAQPDRLVLVAPWLDVSTSTPGTREAAARDPWLSYDHLAVYGGWWAGDVPLDDPRVSPLLGDLTGLPPTLMLCGTRDLLQPACDALFERADSAGWDLTYEVAPGLIHVYPLLPIPEAGPALDSIVEFVRSR